MSQAASAQGVLLRFSPDSSACTERLNTCDPITVRSLPRRLYERVYCARAEVENRIKELHHGLEIDRTSCSRFLANQLRVLLTAAAYVLMQELRWVDRRGGCAHVQVSTLRERLLKLGVWVERSVRRVVLHLPQTFAYREGWFRIARSVGTVLA